MRASRLYRFSAFVSGTARQLRPQAIGDTAVGVDQAMQLILIRHTLIPRDHCAVGCSGVERSGRRDKRGIASGV
jgi:hypothetical protein